MRDQSYIILDAIQEATYTQDHPEVIAATLSFQERANLSSLFTSVRTACAQNPERGALVVGASWLRFTEQVPRLLCQLAANADDNLARHFLIQTTFEELGGRSRSGIHCELFAQSLDYSLAGGAQTRNFSLSPEGVMNSLAILSSASHLKGNARIMGLCLGLELPANENITTLWQCMTPEVAAQRALLDTPFFRIHTVVEDEHVRLSVANFLHFCGNPGSQAEFEQGFAMGVDFWRQFWTEVMAKI